MTAERPRRRRREPQAARQEILDAAARLFTQRPPHEVTVRTIMDATTLARSSFYDYFDRRGALVLELVEPLMEVNRAVIERWPLQPVDPRGAARDVAAALVATWRTHGRLLAALAEAAREDQDAAAAFQRFSQDSIAQVARKLRMEVEAGSVSGIDPDQAALAIVLMNRAYITAQIFSPNPVPDEVIVGTLVELWVRILWPGR